MRIIFSTDQIYLHGGVEKVMAEKANYFVDVLGYEVFILTTDQQKNLPCYKLSPKVNLVNLSINYSRKISYYHPLNLLKIPKHIFEWKRIIKQLNPDFIIVCNYSFDFFWTPFCFRKILKIKEFHSSRYFDEIIRANTSLIKKIVFQFNDWIESKYDRIILLNQDELKYYRSDNLIVIPNSVKIENKLNAELVNKKVIAAGRINTVKGFDNAILCWYEITKEAPEWELHIYGQGEKVYVEKLKKIISDLGLNNNIFIMDAVDDLPLTMAEYSFYLLTSQTESFSMVILEALSVGLPVVSFDCPTGPRNLISNDYDGLLVNNQDLADLVKNVSVMIKDTNKRILMGQNAKKKSAKFSTKNVMLKWQQLFKSLIDN
jgi:glycosyltransferase involved in cell wall biosynthesis